jgi:formylglycine-generating enzyme required for sulfatase activity
MTLAAILFMASVSAVCSDGGAAAPARIVDSAGLDLVRIPAGEFVMGSPVQEGGRRANEGPPRRVRITRSFYMGAHEVTVGQFAAFVEATGYVTEAERDLGGGFGIDFETGRVVQDPSCNWRDPGFPGHEQSDEHPVMLISWRDAEAFCRWLSHREGVVYRLPTEAEWEYACRAGTTTAYWTGDESTSLNGAANVADRALGDVMPVAERASEFDDGHAFTAPVGSFAPNPLGLYDMHGNVWEWCSDWYDERAYALSPDADDPPGPSSGSFRTIRGGGWLNGPARSRSAQRIYFVPTFRYCLLSGFRVVREVGGTPPS